ncbi:PAS domain S-box protein [Cupriavidus necator]|uniref:Aerotaxis sensor receptor (Chemotaxis transducer) transmembrane protein n=1 Tax=Cupriavidus necator (strain ATCC 17699 / DSM 428 / KCTC 22496 / NCIMB 10442 / H16 / Stanier 337) TaxID=381666 RepID=Q0K2E5_CUPNH|nr:PAS domain-containing methyl-accepting chemotaxis protein [Cupriavidus necator]KUE85571.1 aerotaxis receptor Aer [Cupriavidus necator]QCC03714.1 PAS domain-containing methyl-accepting chemotaxis protein [Cupriavidus necator H16]WKA45068.1 methyl-accepting chemotaxis protein [Cupriavidus necator]CAJ95829.1 aerotaxis sensor receptor (chemotaxis transducer) transmembrane protein [Cupriavidus necator H16]
MRDNQPVTQREFDFPDNATLMSTTDTQSYITYANAAFVEVSGFTREEIQGQPHNLVRHPDMPAEAFADMWATLKGGEPWTALVKNRRKNGDHYWVRANATPVVRNGRPAGYMSVRTKATREEIAAAEKLYRDFREGQAGSRKFHKGLIVRTGLMAFTSLFQTMPVRWRVRLALAALLPVSIIGAWGMGLSGMALPGFAGVMALATLLASWWLQRQITTPLEQVLQQALRVASGESQKAVHMNRVDEIGMTLRTISQLGLMFRWLIDDVSGQVVNVQTASNEIARGNIDLSARTEQAASSVQETSASMAQMTSTVQSNAETAAQANKLSGSASVAAERGGQAVSEVVNTMNEITESSRRIADIIGVIDGIAFQTNILALNAAVEAARAGEQGRGFAVVAGEVRSLAQRSANAAKEIKGLIDVSVHNVASGAKLVDEAGKAMDDIVSQVKRVSDLIAEISAATTEQSSGISQVGGAVSDLDNITQQNAALVEQSAAAAESLKQQATRLVEAVSVFR